MLCGAGAQEHGSASCCGEFELQLWRGFDRDAAPGRRATGGACLSGGLLRGVVGVLRCRCSLEEGCGARTFRAVFSSVWCGMCGDMVPGLASGIILTGSVRDRLVLCEMVARLMP